MGSLKEYLDWFENFRGTAQYSRFMQRPIAYFCAEYGLGDQLPTYAGGLGVLAGDVIREAGDRGIPMVAIGLYYHYGYSCGDETHMNRTKDECTRVDPQKVGLEPVTDDHGDRIYITIPIKNHDVVAQAWKWRDENVVVYLLDTDIEQNEPVDRRITDWLYERDKETRMMQYIVLGIGGQRLIEAMGIHPSIYHMNEGHSAILALELIKHQMAEREISFDEAKQFVRRRVVMTNHTLVAAGNEVYSNDLVAMLLAKYANELQVPVQELVKLGLVQESSTFSMTMLALRMAGVVNAVSKLHAEKAREIWTDHPMVAVTNGVHLPTWDLMRDVTEESGAFWKMHQERKGKMLKLIEEKTGVQWGEDDLVIGWARRFVKYKRPLAILKDIERFKEIAGREGKAVRLVYAGVPHASDEDGQARLKDLKDLIEGELAGFVTYLPDYSIEEAQFLISGCDVWLNTPVVGFEACGTSGMKAAVNGVLPFSTKDGWVYEAQLFGVGWEIDGVKVSIDALDKLENDILPVYLDRNKDGVPEKWEQMMRSARDMGRNQFSATRMVRKYVRMLYL
ncbi:MAG: alpha-glucan family phosphorylase [Patescibacteria group bacterium]|nr:alpha-glucan family phosphorylase [Patescibacteria group bacterium]